MKKTLFAFAVAAALFIGGQTDTAHADTNNHVDHSPRKEVNDRDHDHPLIKNNLLLPPQKSTKDEIKINWIPSTNVTSQKHFKVPENDTIDGDGEITDPSKGNAVNHYTGDNVNGDAQTNDQFQPKQGQML